MSETTAKQACPCVSLHPCHALCPCADPYVLQPSPPCKLCDGSGLVARAFIPIKLTRKPCPFCSSGEAVTRARVAAVLVKHGIDREHILKVAPMSGEWIQAFAEVLEIVAPSDGGAS